MGLFSWMFGNSKSAAQARARTRGLRLYDPDQIAMPRTQTQTQSDSGDFAGKYLDTAIDGEPWIPLISSNVDRIRYHEETRQLQVVFHAHGRSPARAYRYWNVEPEIFEAFKHTHSPGQFVHYVLIAYHYPYEEMSGSFTSSQAPAAPRYDEQPFGVPERIQEVQRRAGRGMWDFGAPTSRPYNGPESGAPMTPLD